MTNTILVRFPDVILKSYFILQFLLVSGFACSQERSELNSWTSFGINYNINKSIRLRTKFEYRIKDNLHTKDRWSINAGIGYKLNQFIEIKGAYEFHNCWKTDGSRNFRQRYNLGAQAFYSIDKLKFSWRERFQQTFDDGNQENLIRSRIKIDYSLLDNVIVPQFSVECFQLLDGGGFPEIFRTRYIPGVKFNMSRKYSLLCFYCRQNQANIDKNILGVDFVLSL